MSRRILLGAIAALMLAGTGGAFAAGRQTIVPLHQLTVNRAVALPVSAVHVHDDYGQIAVTAGSAPAVHADEWWNYQQPTVSITEHGGVLTVRATCPTLLNGPVLYIGDPGVDDCSIALSITVPSAASLEVTSYGGDLSTAGINGNQQLEADGGATTVRTTRSPRLAVSSLGPVDVDGAAVGQLTLDASSNPVSASHLTASSASIEAGSGALTLSDARSSGAVRLTSDAGGGSLQGATAGSLTAEAGSGTLAVSDSRLGASVHLTADAGPVSLRGISAGSLSAEAASGTLAVSDVRLAGTAKLVADAGPVTTDALTANQFIAQASSGTVVIDQTGVASSVSVVNTGGSASVGDLSASSVSIHVSSGTLGLNAVAADSVDAIDDAGPVDLQMSPRPQNVDLEATSDIQAEVPRGAYVVSATSDSNGTVSVTGITEHSDSHRTITAHTTQGNITITGE